jgi:hypothetical protein
LPVIFQAQPAYYKPGLFVLVVKGTDCWFSELVGWNCPAIYLIVNRVNRRLYVGQSKHVRKRLMEHISRLRLKQQSPTTLIKDWYEYGYQAFDFVVWEKCPEDRLRLREKFWLGQFDNDLLYNREYVRRLNAS